jgi:hypothetical protein
MCLGIAGACSMAASTSNQVEERDIQGLKHFSKIRKLLKSLHEMGCDRDRANNRNVHMDEYCLGVLLYMFNPTITSLRGIQQASELRNVQKKLGIKRASLGALSESVSVFDPEPLKQIAVDLAAKVPGQSSDDFSQVKQTITAVDGSVVDTLGRIAELAWVPKKGGQYKYAYRLHTQFEVLRGVPNRIDVTPSNPKGKADERAVLAATLEPDRCYLKDRGYAKFTLWNDINALGSTYVGRIRDNSVYEVVQQNELTEEDSAEGVLSDQIVTMGASSKPGEAPDHKIRIIEVQATPHTSRGKYKGGSTGHSSDGKMRLVTNMLDVPAELISKLYRLRWMIELFFRTIKTMLHCNHLLSTKQNGVEIQAYMAIIACLLILIYTGSTPSKRTFEMICLYLQGWAELDELESHIEKLKAKQAKKRNA